MKMKKERKNRNMTISQLKICHWDAMRKKWTYHLDQIRVVTLMKELSLLDQLTLRVQIPALLAVLNHKIIINKNKRCKFLTQLEKNKKMLLILRKEADRMALPTRNLFCARDKVTAFLMHQMTLKKYRN